MYEMENLELLDCNAGGLGTALLGGAIGGGIGLIAGGIAAANCLDIGGTQEQADNLNLGGIIAGVAAGAAAGAICGAKYGSLIGAATPTP